VALSVADVERWDADSVRQVFLAASTRADATLDASRELSTLAVFVTWGGAAAEAAAHSFAQTRQDLDAHGREALAVAAAADRAADSIDRLQAALRELSADAEARGLEVDSESNRIVLSPHSTHGRRQMQAAITGLQARLDGIVAEGNMVDAELAAAINKADGDRPMPTTGPDATPPPPVPGQPVDPADPFAGNPNYGTWEEVPLPAPYVGSDAPPLTPEYRPFPEGMPLKVGGTTGMYTPGKTWVTDDQAPYAQLQEQYRFRLAGTEATTVTRMIRQDGVWKQQRWVQNVYEYQRNTQVALGGDVQGRKLSGDIGGTPTVPIFDQDWEPTSLPQIIGLSANNAETTYYLPDGCGGQLEVAGGVVQGGAVPPKPPIIIRPRG
jgi:hypothetical protein